MSGGRDGDEYIEIDLTKEEKDNKVMVKLFTLKQYEDINEVLNALREGYTITVVEIKTLKQKDPIELKRAISKLKKTTDALRNNCRIWREFGYSNTFFRKDTEGRKPNKR